MSQSVTEYAERTAQGGWRVAGSRISLDSIVQAYWDGESPEAIAREFPPLSNEQVHGAIAYYLRHKDEIDSYLAQQADTWKKLAVSSDQEHGSFLERLRSHRGGAAE